MQAFYGGLSNFEMELDSFSLGSGITVQKTFAHLMAPFLVGFHKAPPGKRTPGKIKAVSGGFGFDAIAELHIPNEVEKSLGHRHEVARIILILSRLTISPAISMPVIANRSFNELEGLPDQEGSIKPYEVQPRYFPLHIEGATASEENLSWLRDHWSTVYKLNQSSPKFSLAISAIDSCQTIPDSGLIIASLWASLEALFSPSNTELRFRISALIATFLEPPGEMRLARQKAIMKMYDRRSEVVHGNPKHDEHDVLELYKLLREILLKIIEDRVVPDKASLERSLFMQ